MPPKTRRPRTCLADCVGMRRWPLVMATTPTTTATNSTIRTTSFSKLDVAAAAAAEREHRLLELAVLEEQRRRRRRHAGDDAGHDDEADAVADAVLVDLLAEPHQEDGAAVMRHDHRDPAQYQSS